MTPAEMQTRIGELERMIDIAVTKLSQWGCVSETECPANYIVEGCAPCTRRWLETEAKK